MSQYLRFHQLIWKRADDGYVNVESTTTYGYIQSILFFTIYYDDQDKSWMLTSKLPGFAGRLHVKSLKHGKLVAKEQLNIFCKKFLRRKIKKER